MNDIRTSAADAFAWKVSRAALAEAEAVIQMLSPIEPDLATMVHPLEAIQVISFTPDEVTSAWRGLYLSIQTLPRRIVLVGSIDDTPELAGLADHMSELLVVETDAAVVSTATLLPRGMQWRSLSEFGASLEAEDRFKLTTAVIHNLQPATALIIGSRAGWEMLAQHGRALSFSTTLFAVVAASPGVSAASLLASYLLKCMPRLSALYGADEQALHHIAELFGLSQLERNKIKGLKDWRDAQGFLSLRSLQK